MRPIHSGNWQISAKRTGKRFGATDSGYESLRYERMTISGHPYVRRASATVIRARSDRAKQ